ncbi:hypothetical protein G7Y89_g11828 [Cudoniella acicularis]|uniref:Heterokaryon incompatibility domain-containing protein n=1 Tax=Cudoniella acicularis TaxID=354080 RepID=A0A8H4RD07_9HELO|nr:hypothetical protein G7Y89_g11828 [Cudoniella acicularis]
MRFINVKTLKFEEFIGEIGNGIPTYAILSHTWGKEEVSYSDYINQQSLQLSKKGYEKILGCCRLAESEGFQYVWIDTCCIDKSSSAELSEAINSMFQWYRDAGICYAYLSDVDSSENPSIEESSFFRSRWFTRGWTLQELLAPAEVVFTGSDWVEIGTKKSLCSAISLITNISENVLDECRWDDYSVAQKMSWASGRQTTRLEDEAYCLMGLFDVNMPLLYGEGRKAFSRLQQEILKQSDDQSIFAWSYPEEMHSYTQMSGLIAPSPKYFKDASRIELLGPEHGEGDQTPFQVVNQLVRLRLRLVDRIKAMRLQRLLGKPLLYAVAEVQQPEEFEMRRGGSSTAPSLPESQREPTFGVESLSFQMQQFATPIITIEAQDTCAETSEEGLRASSGFPHRTMEDIEIDDDFALHRTKIEALTGNSDSRDLSLEPVGPMNPKIWRWYIYEPAIIVPLRCHVGGRRLGILLSKVSNKALSRAHNPSILAFEAVQEPRLTSLATVYASISTKTDNKPVLWRIRHLLWPEIRIASLLSASYTVHEDCGPGWQFDRSRAVLVQNRKFQYERDMTDYAPFALFYRMPNNLDEAASSSPARAFFVSFLAYGKTELKCEIGVNMNVPTSFMTWEYDLYSFDLARERRAEVSLGDGQAIVVKYREGSGLSFVNLSLETLNEDRAASPMPHDTVKTNALRSKIFPMLRSLP